jgi:hypothetical protein
MGLEWQDTCLVREALSSNPSTAKIIAIVVMVVVAIKAYICKLSENGKAFSTVK